MAARNVSRFYPAYEAAVQAVADLIAAGVPESAISLILSEEDRRLPPETSRDDAQPPAAVGAKLGGGIGGGLGVLLGIGAIAVPGLEFLANAGWFATLAAGAGAGALLGAGVGMLTGMGATRQGHRFAMGLQRGQPLVLVRTDDAHADRVEAVLARPHQPAPPLAAPPAPATSLAAERAAIHRDEQAIQYTGE